MVKLYRERVIDELKSYRETIRVCNTRHGKVNQDAEMRMAVVDECIRRISDVDSDEVYFVRLQAAAIRERQAKKQGAVTTKKKIK